ncbi:ParB N-terminal domain-containing protein [Saccharolobus islandicus]|uniref:ParB N-terminal domain-containing protein n=1 Tax=Saccharolobus islandicus TaxID=43080 RepID=UPI000B07E825|nr:ParB N-terminal domain-containing protein [Sulfolobus islandicus]
MTELTYTEEIVPIEKLREDEEFRSLVPPNNMKEQLVSSIVKNGQTLPIDVDSDYVILDGYKRVSILRELKYKEIKVRKWSFRSQEDRATAYRLIAMLNLQRRHLEKNEVLKLLRELAEKIEKVQKKYKKCRQMPRILSINLKQIQNLQIWN